MSMPQEAPGRRPAKVAREQVVSESPLRVAAQEVRAPREVKPPGMGPPHLRWRLPGLPAQRQGQCLEFLALQRHRGATARGLLERP
jgi:hypothetical protein